jgi:TolB-like protein/class 3 adenylate cyclase/Tfp pilus assembly protein PilF
MVGERVERRLAAVLAADVAGYSRLMGSDEEGTLARLKAIRKALVDPIIAFHRGRIVKTTGDGMLVEFASAVDAVRGAVEVQRSMAERRATVPQDKRVEFRIGIHVGDIIIDDNDIFGDGVNIAARLEGVAEPGGVCISNDAYRQVRGKVDIVCENMGPQQLKNIAEPMQAWRIRLSDQTASAVQPGETASESQSLPLPDKPSIAVLPFQNMSGDPEQEYFADGMVEEIITALSRNKQFFVVARNSSFMFKGKAVDIKQVAQDLGVRYVLEGSVRKSGNRIRITGQLIDAASGAHLWADRFDGVLEDVFDLQDQVASSVAGAIDPSVTRAEVERISRKPPSSFSAYDYWLRGRAAQFQFTRESNEQAITLYEQAIALDPKFALAHASLGHALNNRRSLGWSNDPAADASRSVERARSALALGTSDPLVLTNSATCLMFSGGEVEFAHSLYEEAIRLDPNGLIAWIWGGWAKMLRGDNHTAIKYAQRAQRLSPIDPRVALADSVLAYAHFFLGNYEDGLKCATSVARRIPSHFTNLRAAIACHAFLGNVEAAKSLFQELAVYSPSERISDVPKRFPGRPQDVAKLQEAYRIAGMPE